MKAVTDHPAFQAIGIPMTYCERFLKKQRAPRSECRRRTWDIDVLNQTQLSTTIRTSFATITAWASAKSSEALQQPPSSPRVQQNLLGAHLK